MFYFDSAAAAVTSTELSRVVYYKMEELGRGTGVLMRVVFLGDPRIDCQSFFRVLCIVLRRL